jgi:hypothetical protein
MPAAPSALALLAGSVLALGASAAPTPTPIPPSAPPAAARVRFAAPAVEGLWIEATPLSWGSEARVFSPAPGARALALTGVPAGLTMLCAGAAAAAPQCTRVSLTGGGALDLPPLGQGVRVTGRVMVGRQAAAGLRISVAPEGLVARRAFSLPLARAKGGEGLVRDVASDLSGRYAIPRLAPGRYFLEARSPGGRSGRSEPFTVPAPERLRRTAGDAAELAEPTESPEPATLDLGDWALAAGVDLPVTVADAAGAPIAGAEVAALQGEAPAAQDVSAARTGPDGRAALTRLDPALSISIACSAPGYVRAIQELERLPPEVRCALARRASLEGRLLDGDEKPIAGATLRLERSQRSTASDRVGAFSFDGLVPGRYRLTAAAPGYRAVARDLDLLAGERRSLGVVRLSPAERLFGEVVDAASGEPVAGASIAVVEPAGGGSARADEEGRFALAAGSASGLRLEIRAGGFPAKRVDVGPEPRATEEEPLVIQLARGGRVQVAVWDESADAPCLGCTVNLMGNGADPETLLTDASGQATSELLDPGEWDAYLETVESAGATVRVHSGDAVRHVTVGPGAVSRVEFGRHATLTVGFSSPLPPGWMLAADSATFHSSVGPGADGTFAVRRAAGEPITLALVDAALRRVQQAVVPADYGDPALTLPLPATSVSGLLRRDETPLPDRAVSLVGAGLGAASTVADAQGAFQIPFVPPGVYTLHVEGRPLRVVEVSEGAPLDLGILHVPG